MLKKVGKVVCSLAIIGFIGTNIAQAAGSSIAQISSKNINPVGSTVSVNGKLATAAQNYSGSASFKAMSKKDSWGFDSVIASSAMSPGDEFYTTNNNQKGNYYAAAEYTSGGAAYLSGYVSAGQSN